MILLFWHGWAFDRTVWQGVTALLPEFDCRLADRGYFGTPDQPDCGDDAVVVAHSLGTMHVLAAPPPRCRGLVAINGFDRFSAAANFPGVAPRVLDRMMARLDDSPAAVVREFRQRCGAEGPVGPLVPDVLRADLAVLRDGDCRAQAARWDAPIVLVEAEDDPILPPALRGAVFASAPRLHRQRQATGGHLLPVSAPAACAAAIRELVDLLP